MEKKNQLYPSLRFWNNRRRFLLLALISLAFILFILLTAHFQGEELLTSQVDQINQPPSGQHLFGTDWLGRDMLAQTIQGLSISIQTGLISTLLALVLGLGLGLLSSVSDTAGIMVKWLIKVFLSLPGMIFMILISVIFGRGLLGVSIAIALTHWAGFARLVQNKLNRMKKQDYVLLSRRLGRSNLWIAFHHFLPQLLSLTVVNVTLTFPGAILHEAALTVLGFGLPPTEPAIGVILSESMSHLTSGHWWLMFFPGVSLLLLVFLIQKSGDYLQSIFSPQQAHL